MLRPFLLLGAISASAMPVSPSHAAEQNILDPIVVEETDTEVKLDMPVQVGSHLGLTPFETPAMIDVITQEDMQQKGLRNLIEVYNSAPGVRAGNLPGEPGVTTMRGFSRGATGYLVDGVRAVDPLLVSRNYDSFNFDRVEILKGPASVINGTGALAGAINLVTRQPSLEKATREALASYGSYDSTRLGAAFNQPVNDKTAVAASVSYGKSNGWVDDTDSDTFGLTTGILTKATDRLTLSASVNYFHDNFETAYFGTPLIAASQARDPSGEVMTQNCLVLDKSIRRKNYNVTDGLMESDTVWLRTDADYKLSDTWKINNELSYFTADRYWGNSEDYRFNNATNLLDRTSTLITHDHQFWSNRLMASNDAMVAGLRNRFSIGTEYIDTDFGSRRRFGNVNPVDPFNPSRGTFPADTAGNFATRQNFDSNVQTVALFAENALNLTPEWLVLGGIRQEHIELDRTINNLNTNAVTNFGRDYETTSWRIGTVYDINPNTALFAQYNQGAVPITSLLLSNTANAAFDLSTGHSVEAGVKSVFWKDRATVTFSAYQIDQDDILTRDAANPALTVQGGSQRSRGLEIDASLALTKQWTVGANGNVQKVEFTELRDSAGNDLEGNRPPNVPAHTLNFYTFYTLEAIPLTVGADIRHEGGFYTDNANTIEVDGHTLLDASLSYPVGNGTLILRGRNLTNAFYADWSGYSSTQVYVGQPRTFDLTYSVKF